MPQPYSTDAPTRDDVNALPGAVVLEFGTDWCGYCQQAQPVVGEVLAAHPSVRHVKVEDGPGRPLGRSFGIKLWPTLVFLVEGREVARVVRPRRADELGDAMRQLLASRRPD